MSLSSGVSSDSPVQDDPGIAMLKLMANPAALAAKIGEYEAAKMSADASIALVGKANQISAILQSAKENSEHAVAVLAKAQTDAAAIVSKANEEAEKVVFMAKSTASQSQTFADRMKAEAASAVDDASKARSEAASVLSAAKAEADKILSAAKEASEQVDVAKVNAENMYATASALKSKFESKLKKLQAASADD